VEASHHVPEPIRKDEEFVLCRGEDPNEAGPATVLLLAPASTRPALQTLADSELR
jgi:hypothetical protein